MLHIHVYISGRREIFLSLRIIEIELELIDVILKYQNESLPFAFVTEEF